MTDPGRQPTEHGAPGADGLWRWLVGGLVAGGVVLGLLVAAYAIGYHRGQQHARVAAQSPAATRPASTATTAPATTAPATTAPETSTTVPLGPALVARGKNLYQSDGCSACHSLNGAPGAGPTFKGLAGSRVSLSSGQTVTADAAYLARSIADPDAQIVDGYRPGIMPAAIAQYDLADKPADIRALVAFIESQR
ncbi:MAG TPA: cytochrome c [Gaiellaceae bacterium]|nr:cytochrome c [Gaiellaceae bacterium]